MPRRLIPLLLAACLLPSLGRAACPGPAFRQFDFWIGDWNVSDAGGKLIGRDRVERRYGGCALEEHWTSVDGGTGASLSIYDVSRKLWHQTWVDSTGTLVVLEGGYKDGRMEMTGVMTGADGKRVQDRMTWTPLDGKIHQHWETTSDGGKTWDTVFDAVYTKVR